MVSKHDSGRLESWKQIAAYLGRSERTVRRWHEAEGLPVHRHVHQLRGSVWAYQSEIDRWLEQRRISPETPVEERAPAEEDSPVARARSHWGTGLLIGSALIAAATGLSLLSRREPPEPVLLPVQITATPGGAYAPTFSPDGHRLAVRWTPTGDYDPGIYVTPTDREHLTPLVTGPETVGRFDYSPSWSPDGRTIAFLRRAPPPGYPALAQRDTFLCVVPAEGGQERCLIRLAENVFFRANFSHLSWAKDSRSLFAPMADNEHRGIYRVSIETGEAIRVTPGNAFVLAPALSPDGRALAYVRREGSAAVPSHRLLRLNLNSAGNADGEPIELLGGGWTFSGFAWLPTSDALIACGGKSAFMSISHTHLFRVGVGPVSAPVLLGIGDGCSTLAIAPPQGTGKSDLVYAGDRSASTNLYQARLPALSSAIRIAPSSRFDALPAFSPDGSLIAFVSDRSEEPELWLTRPGSNTATRLTDNADLVSAPRWSPNGSELVYAAADRSGQFIYTLPVTGGAAARVPVPQPSPADPFWSEDGSLIYYWAGSELWHARPGGSEAARVGSYMTHYIRSTLPFGDHVYLARQSKPFALVRIDLRDGHEEVVMDGLATPFLAASRHRIFYTRHPDFALAAMPVSGGPGQPVAQIPGYDGVRRSLFGIAASPDEMMFVWAMNGGQQLDLYRVAAAFGR